MLPLSSRGPKTAFYRTLLKHRKQATIITRTRTIDPATGVPTVVEARWSGTVAFVLANQAPRNDQVVVTDAWAITDQPLSDKSEIHVDGKAYTVLKLFDQDAYKIATLKAAAPAEQHVAFRSDQTQDTTLDEVPPDQIWVKFHDNHEPADELSSSLI